MPRIDTAATTLTLLPGHSEDTPGDGHAHDSAMPDYGGKSLDAWFTADHVTDYPDDLEAALEMRRDLPEYDERLRRHRLMNRIELGFATPDGRRVRPETVRHDTNADRRPSYVAVEGQPGEENAVHDIVERDDLEWFDNRSKLRAEIDRLESGVVRETVRGVEGIRASVLLGGRDTFIVIMKEKFDELGPVAFLEETGMDAEAVPAFVVQPPTMYTFLDVVAMADGATLARVWDVSPYPKHYLYADGRKRDETPFEEDEHWERREDMNQRFGQWVVEEQQPRTPFSNCIPGAYEQYVGAATLFDPIRGLHHGEDGDRLTADELAIRFGAPLFPWHSRETVDSSNQD